MSKIPDIAKTTYSGGLAGTSQWVDYASDEPLTAEDLRKAFQAIVEHDQKQRQAEQEHWNREGFKEAYGEICRAIIYYLDTDEINSYGILQRCRMAMEYNGYPVSDAMEEEGRKLLDEYRNKMLINS